MTTYDKLAEIAWNLWWSWNPEVLDLFRRLDPEAYRRAKGNPIPVLASIDASMIRDSSLIRDIDAAHSALRAYLTERGDYGDAPRISYFCMEYGLHGSLPIYSGGLGVLAGDHAKAASDLGLPFTAIGLLLREGYFEQHFTQDGWQLDRHPMLNETEHPLEHVLDRNGDPLIVTVHLGEEPVHLHAWRVRLGRIEMYFLDADFEANSSENRALTHKLYQGDRRNRLQQEIILGIGGVRLLRALGIATDVYHMNEGHCAFLAFELMRERLALGNSLEEAESWTRDHCVFTTHTPVMAGHDRFEAGLLLDQLRVMQSELSLSDHDLLAYGRVHPHNPHESFTMTVLGIKLARSVNGVSRLNGEVAREQWHALYPDRPVEDVPIGYVTNGVHLGTWTTLSSRAFLSERLGDWQRYGRDPDFWSRVDEIPDEVLWEYRNELRAALVDFAVKHVSKQTLPMSGDLDPKALTIGFARRFATYKRAPLLLSDLERLAAIVGNADRPVQILYAGKAHPADDGGKRFIQRIAEAGHHPVLRGRIVFLENYDIAIGRMLVSGCDVWLNNPRRPMEASGTSGQKIAVHGGLNLSILDGWWPEGYNGLNGWAISPEGAPPDVDHDEQDARDAAHLYGILEQSVIPEFYDRNERSIPGTWMKRMRSAMRELPAKFSAERMVIEYVERIYMGEAIIEAQRAAAGG